MMSKFVVDFYQNKVKEMKVLHARHMSARPGEVKTQDRGKGSIRHPGEDRDSDDEAEGKNTYVEIHNEVEADEEKVMSSENKAAQAVDKVFAQSEEQHEVVEEVDKQMETAENISTS